MPEVFLIGSQAHVCNFGGCEIESREQQPLPEP